MNIRQTGLHLIGTLNDCDKYIMCDSWKLMNFLHDFPPKIGMTVIDVKNNPYLHRTHEKYGWTGGATLYESHIQIHCWPEFLSIDFDVFSCKEFDFVLALKEIREYFIGNLVGCMVLERGHYGASVLKIKEDLNEVE